MQKQKLALTRREFIATTGTAVAGAAIATPLSGSLLAMSPPREKMRLAIVGTGVRACGMYGKNLLAEYSDYVEIAGLCDINPGRLAYAKSYMGVTCPTFTDLEKMLAETKPDKLIVTTVDSTHHEQIIRGLETGADVITEKPMTTDEIKAQAILDAERRTGRNVIVTFNYRYSPHRARIKELLMANAIGNVTSVDFHWYLDTEHGPRYFRRWHGLREKSGTLLVHKLFKDPNLPDPLKQSAGTRDGAMSILAGIAARKSIDSGKPVQIASLTDLKPQAKRPG